MGKRHKLIKSDELVNELTVTPLFNEADEYNTENNDLSEHISYNYSIDSGSDADTDTVGTISQHKSYRNNNNNNNNSKLHIDNRSLRAQLDLNDAQRQYKGKRVSRAELYNDNHNYSAVIHDNSDISDDNEHNSDKNSGTVDNREVVTKSILTPQSKHKQRGQSRSVSFSNNINHIKSFYRTDIVQTPIKSHPHDNAPAVHKAITPIPKTKLHTDESDTDIHDINEFDDNLVSDSITGTISVDADSNDDNTITFNNVESESDDSMDDALVTEQTNKLYQQLQSIKQQQRTAEQQSIKLLSTSKQNESLKSNALHQQNIVYNQLISLRIKLQSLLNTCNTLPTMTQIQSINDQHQPINTLYNNAAEAMNGLMNDMLHTQHKWFDKINELQDNNALHTPCTTPYDSLNELSTIHKHTEQWCNELIDQWNNRVQSTSLHALQNKQLHVINTSLTKQIQQQYTIEQSRLIEQSHLYTNQQNQLLGRTHTNTNNINIYDAEVYNDIDMYQSILHDIIALNNNSTTNSHNKLHTYKAKKKVDTRATKGRKIKYVVLPKLVSFMAPVVQNNDSNTIVDSLFNGLFSQH